MRLFRPRLSLFMILAALSIGQQACAAMDASSGAATKPAPRVAIPLAGTVLETMDGGGYSYLLLQNGSEKLWVAIPLTKITVGQEMTLLPGYEFKNFASKGLNRKFDRIIFSAGTDGSNIKLSPAAIKMAHERVPIGGQQAGALALQAAPAVASVAPALKTWKSRHVSIVQVSKARGANAYTVAQLYAKRAKLEKRPVVIRGRVVKVATRILKRNWIHIQDGSGSDAKKNNDIVITSNDQAPKEGDVVTARGILYNRIDFGSGYRYELIIQEARLK